MSHQGLPGPPWGQPEWFRKPGQASSGPYPPAPAPGLQRHPDEPSGYDESSGYQEPRGYQPGRGPGHPPGQGQHHSPGNGKDQDRAYRPDLGDGYGSGPPPDNGELEPYRPVGTPYQLSDPYHRSPPAPDPYRDPSGYQPAQPGGYADPWVGPGNDPDFDAPTTQFTRPVDLDPPAGSPVSGKNDGGPSRAKPSRLSLSGKLSRRQLTGVAAGAVALVLMLVSGGVWFLTRDAEQPHASRAAPVSGEEPAADVKAAVGLQFTPSHTAEVLFPATLKPVDQPAHIREAVGEAECVSVAASKEAKTALAKVGCKKVYLALYVDQKRKYAVTFGYIDMGSAAKAKKGADRNYGDYPDYNKWFKFLVPQGSKITTKTRIFTYVSSDEKYLTFGTCAYFDGKDAKKELDEPLAREAIAVGVAIMFS